MKPNWYLISFDLTELYNLEITQEEVDYTYTGHQEGAPGFNVSRGTKLYELEILDNIHDMKHLTELNRINPSVFFLISLTTVLYKWQGDQESLLTAIKPVLADHKKYAIFEVSDITASSFLPVDYLQGLIRK